MDMKQSELVIAVIEAMEHREVPHIIAGSFAAMVYGIPRSTKDADFVIELEKPTFEKLIDDLSPLFSLDPQQHLETLTWTRRFILEAKDTPFKVELFLKGADSHHLVQWERKRRLFNPVIGREVWMPSPEDVVIQKLRWGRPQDRIDAENVLAVQRLTLDWPYIERWCDTHGTRALLEELRAALPPI